MTSCRLRKRARHFSDDAHSMLNTFSAGGGVFIDPILVCALVINPKSLMEDTLIGSELLKTVCHALGLTPEPYCFALMCDQKWWGEHAQKRVHAMLESYKHSFCGTPFDGCRGLKRVCFTSTQYHCRTSAFFSDTSKDAVIDAFVTHCEERNVNSVCPSVIQLVYYRGSAKSHIRIHEIYAHAEDCLLACKNRILEQGDTVGTTNRQLLSIIEIPNKLQLIYNVFFDMDLFMHMFQGCTGPLGLKGDKFSSMPGMQAGRNLVLKSVGILSIAMIALGYLSAEETVQVCWSVGNICSCINL